MVRARIGGLLLIAVVAGSTAAAQGRDSLVIQADGLARLMAGPEQRRLVVLHVGRERAGYDSAHIAGAKFVPLSSFTTARDGVPTELPPMPVLDRLLKQLGISDSSRIVLYGEPLPAARLLFTLDYLGLSRVHWLDGGLAGWNGARAAGDGQAAQAPPTVAGSAGSSPQGPTVARARGDLVVSAEWVLSRLADPGVVLVDARTPEEYSGLRAEEPGRPGHIPGAVNLDWTTLMRDGRLRPLAELRGLFESVGVTPDAEVVTYCRVGTRASFLYFVSTLLGYRTRMYDGSMAEWAVREDLPIAR